MYLSCQRKGTFYIFLVRKKSNHLKSVKGNAGETSTENDSVFCERAEYAQSEEEWKTGAAHPQRGGRGQALK